MDFLNPIPLVGHAKALVHYASGDVEEGNKAFFAATRTTVVAGAGAIAGSHGAGAAGAATGFLVDAGASAVTRESRGCVKELGDAVKDIRQGKVPVKPVIKAVCTLIDDAATGKTGCKIVGPCKSGGEVTSTFKKKFMTLAAKEAFAEFCDHRESLREKGYSSSYNTDEVGTTELHLAATSGNLNRARRLLEEGCKIDAKTEDGATALHLAVGTGNVPMVRLLIEKGCDLNAKNGVGNTALLIAIGANNIPMITLLVEKGCDVNAKNKDGRSPLHLACGADLYRED